MWLLLDINISKTETANIYFYRDFGRKTRQNKTKKNKMNLHLPITAKKRKLTTTQMKFDHPLNARILGHFVSA